MDVTPDKQNIDKVSNTNYHIVFYQRQYKWNEEPVKRLLEDIFISSISNMRNLKTMILN